MNSWHEGNERKRGNLRKSMREVSYNLKLLNIYCGMGKVEQHDCHSKFRPLPRDMNNVNAKE